uniref:F-box/LRR-repeat protein 15/At3g58940/PEG3-like LRR domain-containing protein n=1 Tax=Oryza glumipatula TaxID=40148 RepID=A0A0E0AU69_9ORYZ
MADSACTVVLSPCWRCCHIWASTPLVSDNADLHPDDDSGRCPHRCAVPVLAPHLGVHATHLQRCRPPPRQRQPPNLLARHSRHRLPRPRPVPEPPVHPPHERLQLHGLPQRRCALALARRARCQGRPGAHLVFLPIWPMRVYPPADVLCIASLHRLYLGLRRLFPDTEHIRLGADVFPYLVKLGFCRTNMKAKDLDHLLRSLTPNQSITPFLTREQV